MLINFIPLYVLVSDVPTDFNEDTIYAIAEQFGKSNTYYKMMTKADTN